MLNYILKNPEMNTNIPRDCLEASQLGPRYIEKMILMKKHTTRAVEAEPKPQGATCFDPLELELIEEEKTQGPEPQKLWSSCTSSWKIKIIEN